MLRFSRRMGEFAAAAGVQKAVRIDPDGRPLFPQGYTVPREVRALATEVLVVLGLPQTVECLLDPGATHGEKNATLRFLKDLSIGDAKSLARDGDGEDAPGIALLPALDPRPEPPAVGDESFEPDTPGARTEWLEDEGHGAPQTERIETATGSIAAKLAARKAGSSNGNGTNGNGNGRGPHRGKRE